MASTNLSSIVGSSGALTFLDVDTNFIADKNYFGYTIVNFNPSAGLTTALSLTGKFAITFMRLEAVMAESFTIKLTIDGVVIWNSSRVLTVNDEYLIGSSGAPWADVVVGCNSSFLLEVQSTTDTSVDLYYTARPIL